MALTRLDRIGDGTTTRYSVNFDLGYLRQEYVYVYLEGDNYSNQLSYKWINSSQIELDSPVPNGQGFSIRRIVPRDRIVNDYEDGAILREDNLDDSFLQAIMILQEIQDGYISPDGDFKVDSTIDMLGNEIENCIKLSGLLDTEDPTAAVSLGQADRRFVNADGDEMTGDLGMGNNVISGLKETVQDSGAATYGQLIRLITDRMYQGVGTAPVIGGRQIGDSTTKVFNSPATKYTPAETMFVWIDGVAQRGYEDFTIDSVGKLVFTEAPPNESVIDVTWFEPQIVTSTGVTPILEGRQVGDGVTTVFNTPANEIVQAVELVVNLDGITQRPNTDFVVNQVGQVEFTDAPPIDATIDITWYKPQIVRAGTGVGFTSTTYLGDGVTTHYAIGSTGSTLDDDQIISLDGILQEPIADFVVNNTDIVFSEAPPENTRIVVRSVVVDP